MNRGIEYRGNHIRDNMPFLPYTMLLKELHATAEQRHFHLMWVLFSLIDWTLVTYVESVYYICNSNLYSPR